VPRSINQKSYVAALRAKMTEYSRGELIPMTKLEAEEVARICFRHGLQQRSDKGTYWVHSLFADVIISLDNEGQWQSALPKPGDRESRSYRHDSLDDLDRYLGDFIKSSSARK
jgi:hypothetical protein